MILRSCLLLFGLASIASAACKCYDNQIGPLSVYTPTGPRDDQSWVPCYPGKNQCIFVANTTNTTVGLGSTTIVSFYSPTNNMSLWITLKDGDTTIPRLEKVYPKDVTPELRDYLKNYVTYSSSLIVEMNFDSSYDGYINLATFPTPARVTVPPIATTTTTPFVPITGFPTQPGRIGADIAFCFISAGNYSDSFNDMRSTIRSAVDYFNVVTDPKTTTGVRLGLLAPSLTTKPNTFGDQWQLDLSIFKSLLGVLPSMIGIDGSNWLPGMQAFFDTDGYFDPNSVHPPRKNVEKIFAAFTQTSPIDKVEDFGAALTKLKTMDVHMVVVIYGPDSSDIVKYFQDVDAKTPDLTNFAYFIYDSKSPNDFLNKYILASDTEYQFGCTYPPEKLSLKIAADNPATVSWPLNYGDAQYCNSQNTRMSLAGDDPKTTGLCVYVDSYELETEVDYLQFYYANTVEIASFTGMDIKGSNFLIPSNQTTVVFKTNENTNYKGVTFTVVPTTEDLKTFNCPPQKN